MGWFANLPLVVTQIIRQRRVFVSPATWLLLAILAAALALRLYGINWDQGYGFHPDERSIYMRAGCMYDLLVQAPGYQECLRDHPQTQPGFPSLGVFLDPQRSPLNPHWFPLGSILIYALVYLRSILELFTNLSALDMRYAGRLLSALADVGSVYLVFLLGKRMYGQGTGLLAAAFAAFAVIHIQNSHFYRPETFSVFFTLAAFLAMLRMIQYGRWRDSAILGLLVGLALAPKVNVLPLLLPLALVYGWRWYDLARQKSPKPPFEKGGLQRPSPRWGQSFSPLIKKGLGRIASAQLLAGQAALAAVVALATFFAASPYALLDFKSFVADQIAQANMANHAGLWPFTIQYVGTTPFLYQMRQSITWGLGVPLGLAAWASIPFTAAMAFLQKQTCRADWLLLAWILPSLLLLESFEVRFLRYLFPLIPFMLLLAARMLVWLAVAATQRLDDAGKAQLPSASPEEGQGEGRQPPPLPPFFKGGLVGFAPRKLLAWTPTLLIALVMLGTVFYALAFMRIYARPHPAIAASQWLRENVPAGKAIASDNHWDEFIPGLYQYQVWQYPAYDADSAEKMTTLARQLAKSEYLVFYSQRPFASVSRDPQRFPLSGHYYQQLFAGKLGYQLEKKFISYPELLGVAFQDDPYTWSGLPKPSPAQPEPGSLLALNLGYADDNVVGYDHPQVLVFRNTERLSELSLRARLTPSRQSPDSGTDQGLMLSPEQAAAQRNGGAWSEIVHRDSWTNKLPVLAWLLAVEVIYMASLPLAMFLCRPLPDRGIVLARILGLLAVCYVAWLLASLGWVQFSRTGIWLGILTVAALSAVALAAHWQEIRQFLKARWRLLLLGEALFLAAFLAFVLLRAANPDLWHPYRGGEKPMELAYLNAVARSSLMPPYDPWFAGGYLNYYYWGYFVVAALVRITGIIPTTAFNLAVPLFFALTFTGAFSLVYNLAAATIPSPAIRRRGNGTTISTEQGLNESARPEPVEGRVTSPLMVRQAHHERWRLFSSVLGRPSSWPPVTAGLLGGLMVAVMGNLDGVVQLAQGAWRKLVLGQPFPAFDFWRSSRMVPDLPAFDPSPLAFWMPGHAPGAAEVSPHITEFPYFTFLFADLHAHMMVIPFTLLALGLALTLVLGLRQAKSWWAMSATGVLGLALGSLWVINSWDYPAYLLLMAALLGLAAWAAPGGAVFRAGLWLAMWAAVVAVSVLAFWPFRQAYQTFDPGLAPSLWRTPPERYFAIHGVFLLVAIVHLVQQWRDARHSPTPPLQSGIKIVLPFSKGGLGGFLILALGALAAVYLAAAGYWTAATLTLVLAFTISAAGRELKRDAQSGPCLPTVASLVLLGMALSIGIGLDLARLNGDIGRMNTFFKYYLEAWVLFGVASAYLLWRLGATGFFRQGLAGKATLGIMLLFLVGSLIYPALGARARLADRFNPTALTLDGTAYMRQAVHMEEGQPIALEYDLEAIHWLQDNVQGSPVVLEAHHEQYHWSSRISVYTGLPTVLGWPWHQIQQRGDSTAVYRRAADVREIYSTVSVERAQALLQQHQVRYIVVGELERAYYPAPGLTKFESMTRQGLITLVYQNPRVQVYRTPW